MNGKTFRINDTVEVYTKRGWVSGWFKGLKSAGKAFVMIRGGGEVIARVDDIRFEKRDYYGVSAWGVGSDR